MSATSNPAAPDTPLPASSILLSILGAVAGGGLGFAGVWLLARNGFYGIMLPGALAGIGGGLPLRRSSWITGLIAAIVGLVSMLLAEWKFHKFIVDDSFSYFITHLHKLTPATLGMMALGLVIAFWFGMGRDSKP
jgi:hypothetical protein